MGLAFLWAGLAGGATAARTGWLGLMVGVVFCLEGLCLEGLRESQD